VNLSIRKGVVDMMRRSKSDLKLSKPALTVLLVIAGLGAASCSSASAPTNTSEQGQNTGAQPLRIDLAYMTFIDGYESGESAQSTARWCSMTRLKQVTTPQGKIRSIVSLAPASCLGGGDFFRRADEGTVVIGGHRALRTSFRWLNGQAPADHEMVVVEAYFGSEGVDLESLVASATLDVPLCASQNPIDHQGKKAFIVGLNLSEGHLQLTQAKSQATEVELEVFPHYAKAAFHPSVIGAPVAVEDPEDPASRCVLAYLTSIGIMFDRISVVHATVAPALDSAAWQAVHHSRFLSSIGFLGETTPCLSVIVGGSVNHPDFNEEQVTALQAQTVGYCVSKGDAPDFRYRPVKQVVVRRNEAFAGGTTTDAAFIEWNFNPPYAFRSDAENTISLATVCSEQLMRTTHPRAVEAWTLDLSGSDSFLLRWRGQSTALDDNGLMIVSEDGTDAPPVVSGSPVYDLATGCVMGTAVGVVQGQVCPSASRCVMAARVRQQEDLFRNRVIQ